MTPEQWMQMGVRIRRMRLQRRISMQEMIEKTGFSRSYLQEIERGETHASIEALVVMAEIMKASLDYMILGISPIPGVGDGRVRLRCGEMAREIEEEAETQEEFDEEI